MKILKEKSREYNGKPYYKYKINLPEELLKDSGFKEGDELEAQVKNGEVRLKKK
jgi:bifunctional DNA-binding transcriptional regulator/antitoxin component of YhaV-PrlF toxin-antitoxin module